LGGYVSEKITIGDITTGASNDLERATHLARNMVTRFGMSDLGARTFGKKEEMIFLGREMSEEKDYSERTADQIDKEVSRLIEDARQTAENILIKRKDVLKKIANELLEKETIEKEEYDKLIGIKEENQEEKE